MYTVRRATEADIPALLGLLLQVDLVHHEGRPDLFRGPATKYSGEELEQILKDEDTPVFVCVDGDGRVLGHGFCVLEHPQGSAVLTDVKTLYIDDICVDESARGTGCGRALYEAITDFARRSGCYHVTLNVGSCNPGAEAFYRKMGMKPYKVGMETIL